MVANSAFKEHMEVMKEAARSLPSTLERVAAELYECLKRGNKLLACGNGGSASDADHLVAELVGRYRDERRALPALALTGGMATITAVGNDYGYEAVFARHVEAMAVPGDMLFAISTSGNSRNVLQAVKAAKQRSCRVIGFTGAAGGQLAGEVDVLVAAPSKVTARIQEVHITCFHIICEELDRLLRSSEAA
jgi:D-sedoheptulose 7-phosphate isomerase